ncbi:MAG TPA: hypothetical protein VFQ54_05495 [Thermomicrobiales bacterium]|nr:hypothetical protein [Thermomicrobiales bacterium]
MASLEKRHVSRRALVASSLVGIGLAAGGRTAFADPIDIPTVALPASAATPAPKNPLYTGPIADLWEQPWLLEGKSISIKGTILQRLVAPAGRGYRISDDGIIYRSLLDLDVPSESEVFVVTNDDLTSIADLRTVEAIGSYGGIADDDVNGHHGIPIVIAAVIRRATS